MLAGLWPDIRSFCDWPVVAVPSALSRDTVAVAISACSKPHLCVSSQLSCVDGFRRNPRQFSGLALWS